MNLDDISEVSMDYELFHEMLNWCINKEILSSSYNHGWKPFKNGQQILVNRDYTIKFCFQSSTISDRGNKKTFYKIVRGGRPLPKYGHGKNRGDEAIERLGRDTPSFEEMIYPAISRCQNHIFKIKRGYRRELFVGRRGENSPIDFDDINF
ncbi:hypothetical protein JJJ22_00540 [Aeromonas caviae]|uniref:hypothetical protein n=1 Tax=Aeromonas caviae TaxID=648 RepID=UPI001904C849|nr:hypothetical protein [Aeromonas caviae]MEE1913528.1 hypothetical protein [Aeromonas caviae]QQM73990.1 hypothetical protein JH254_10570 [Aeromonas caviae]QQM73992.1 hypothetical protein JH254_10585 [Aeromonas caviae]QQV19592.1 hypothetical protein JJJ22_00540 [Aeromonas caviae]